MDFGTKCRAGGVGAEGAENSAPLFSRLDTIFPTVLFVGVMYHSIHLLRDSLHVSERDYVTHQAFAASSKLFPLPFANFHAHNWLCQMVYYGTNYRRVRIMH